MSFDVLIYLYTYVCLFTMVESKLDQITTLLALMYASYMFMYVLKSKCIHTNNIDTQSTYPKSSLYICSIYTCMNEMYLTNSMDDRDSSQTDFIINPSGEWYFFNE